MEIDIDKETQAFEQWFSAGDHNGCGIEIWLAAKRHAAQVDSVMLPAGLDREQKRAFIVAHAEPSGASVDSPELIALLDAYCQDATKGYEHHYRKIVAHIDAWHASRASVDSLARDAARYRWLREHWFLFGTAHSITTTLGFNLHRVNIAGDVVTLDAAIDAAMSPTKAGEGM